jgi:hypothetical protein
MRGYFFADGPGFLSVSVGADEVLASFLHQNGTTLTTITVNSTF